MSIKTQGKLTALKELKKAYLQQMFPQAGECVPRVRFAGFHDEWEERKLGDVADVFDGTHQTPNYVDEGVMFLSVENISSLHSRKYISEIDFSRNFKKTNYV